MINYSLKTLKNGLRLVCAPIETTEAVSIFILVGVGARHENEKNNGISHLVEHLFFKGSKKYRSAQTINKELDSLGANYNAFTGNEYTGFFIQCDSMDFKRAFDLISDMFLNPLFIEKEFEKEKGVVLEETKYRHDMPQWLIHVLAQKQMFPRQPLGMDISGTTEAIKDIRRQDIVDYYQKYYRPSSSVIVIAGNPKANKWQDEVQKTFAKFPAKETPKFQAYMPTRPQMVIGRTKPLDQVHFVFSVLTYARSDERNYALSVLTTILGGGSSSRLYEEIREKNSWAYDIRADNSAFADTGMFSIFGGLRKDKLPQAIKIINKEIFDLQKNGPTDEELDRAKRNLRGHLAIALEDSLEVAEFLAEEFLNFGKARTTQEILEKWNAVTKEDIKKIAKDIFNHDKIGIATVGPEDYKVEIEKIIK